VAGVARRSWRQPSRTGSAPALGFSMQLKAALQLALLALKPAEAAEGGSAAAAGGGWRGLAAWRLLLLLRTALLLRRLSTMLLRRYSLSLPYGNKSGEKQHINSCLIAGEMAANAMAAGVKAVKAFMAAAANRY